MERIAVTPRKNWQQKVEAVGLLYYQSQSRPYWNESAYYKFRASEIERLEAATETLYDMVLRAVQYVIDRDRWRDFGVPAPAVEVIKRAWEDEPPSIYGRFDLAYDGARIKLLEYNADTPTSLVEAAVVQWKWLEEVFPGADQFNSIHEKVIAKWNELREFAPNPLYFAHVDSYEDLMTIAYLRDTAEQAGHKTAGMLIEQLGYDPELREFVDQEGNPVNGIFKLYPWEMMLEEEFGVYALTKYPNPKWIEPIWKMVAANKALLAVMWEMNRGHELLLPTYFDESEFRGASGELLKPYVSKPKMGREGANVAIYDYATAVENPGTYGKEGYVYQEKFELQRFRDGADEVFPVIGSWYIPDQGAAGIGIRESVNHPITDNASRFVPHLFE